MQGVPRLGFEVQNIYLSNMHGFAGLLQQQREEDTVPRMEDPGQSTKDGGPLEESGPRTEDPGWITQLDKGWWMQKHGTRTPRIDDQEHVSTLYYRFVLF